MAGSSTRIWEITAEDAEITMLHLRAKGRFSEHLRAHVGCTNENMVDLFILFVTPRQNLYEPPPGFPLASPYSGIVHHLSGPNIGAHTRIFHQRIMIGG
jgi:hypothetical protein